MLIRKPFLEKIKKGEIHLAFRRWQKVGVKAGGTLKTSVGVIRIDSISPVIESKISEKEAKRAGFSDLKSLMADLRDNGGDLYRIEVSFGGEDPRISLREDIKLDRASYAELYQKLRRMDSRSSCGDWTIQTLGLIAENPMLPAIELSKKSGHQKEWLKLNIRKLKNLGLTISHNPGYTLSPRGKKFLQMSKKYVSPNNP
ncbi:MAG: hypothetical protein AAF558_06285 [Verrucomicrobiota bacterium]